METIEDEIIKRYNTLTLQSTYDNINSSSDEEKRDFFGIGKKYIKDNLEENDLPFESNDNDYIEEDLMEIDNDPIQLSKKANSNSLFSISKELSSKSHINEIDMFSHAPTFDTTDSNKKSHTTSRQNSRPSQSTKKSKIKEFQFKFIKRENIDKKVLRKFKKFLKDKYKKNQNDIVTLIAKNKFWYDFIALNLTPPFTYPAEEKEFKSFNTTYMSWVFEHPCSLELYNIFIQSNYNCLLEDFCKQYKLKENDEEFPLLQTYLSTMAVIFGTSTSNDSNASETCSYLFEVEPKKSNENINSIPTVSEKNETTVNAVMKEDSEGYWEDEEDDYRFYNNFNHFY